MASPGTGLVDLRSDTVTRPTPAMRRAMATAEVGDDVYGEDPTVNALEEAFAARVGKQAALYVASGTMGNQVALRTLARPGTMVVAGRHQHIVIYEHGGAQRNAGVALRTVDDSDGRVSAVEVNEVVEAARHHQPHPSLVCVENTHMPAGGVPWPLAALREVAQAADDAGLALHMDGARLFNAEVATATPAADYAAACTTVMCCLSKGLGAPVGSLLAGPTDVMARAREERAVLGGAMRQAGVIAAAGLVALETMVDRLAEDHARARRLAEVVAQRWPDAGLDPATVTTNMVIWRPPHRSPTDVKRLLDHLCSEGVLGGTIAPGTVRLVTHHDVDDRGIERATKAITTAP